MGSPATRVQPSRAREPRPGRPLRLLLVAAAALGGGLLFYWAIRDVGWAEVAAGIRRVGWGLLPILALSGLRFVFRAEAWRQCMPAEARIPHRQAFAAYLAGDALGNVTPLGLIASEPTKIFLMRHRLATREAASSLALDIFVYTTSVALTIAIGLLALLAILPMASGWRQAIAALLVVMLAGTVVAWRLVGGTWRSDRVRPRWRASLASLRESALAVSGGGAARLSRVLLLHMGFHAMAFVEVFLTLRWLLGSSPSVAEALVFTALDRVVMVAFKFVPFRIGVDEASSGGVAALLGWGPATGVALAIIKKVRNLAWTGVGLLLIAAHPARAGQAEDLHGSDHGRPT